MHVLQTISALIQNSSLYKKDLLILKHHGTFGVLDSVDGNGRKQVLTFFITTLLEIGNCCKILFIVFIAI